MDIDMYCDMTLLKESTVSQSFRSCALLRCGERGQMLVTDETLLSNMRLSFISHGIRHGVYRRDVIFVGDCE
jgi:hypothetical protein